MKTWIKSVRDRLFGTRHTAPIRKHQQSRRRMALETLEDRAVPATWYVDIANTGTETGSSGNPFNTIQEGVNAANAGDTILVATGTYKEDVTIGIANLTLKSSSGAATTTIEGVIGGSANTLYVTANGVTIEGFTITRDNSNLANWDAGNNNQGVSFQGGNGGTLKDSIIVGNRNGVYVNNAQNIKILNNVIDDNRTGVQVANNVTGLEIKNNFITDNWTLGVLFNFDDPSLITTSVTVTNNLISGNWYGGVVRKWTNSTAVLDVSGNSFGTATPVFSVANTTEPGHLALIPIAYGGSASAPGGAPDVVDYGGSPRIDYGPWLSSSTDTNGGVAGFQGDFSSLNVSAAVPQSGGTGRIQEAVNLLADGALTSGARTITVGPGTYSEQLTLNKSLTLDGAGSGLTDTVIQSPTAGQNTIDITANTVTVKDVRVTTGSTVAGRAITVSGTDNVILDNVAAVGSYTGLEVGGTTAENLQVLNSSLSDNNLGFRMGTAANLDGLIIDDSVIANNSQGMTVFAASSGSSYLTNVTVSDTQFTNNLIKGAYFEKLNNASFSNITVTNNGIDTTYNFNSGFDLNLKYAAYSNISFTDSTFTDNGIGATSAAFPGSGLTIKGRNDGAYASPPVGSVANVTLTNVSISANEATPGAVVDLSFGNNVNLTTVTLSNVDLAGDNTIGLTTFGNPPGTLSLGDTSFDNLISSILSSGTTVTVNGSSKGDHLNIDYVPDIDPAPLVTTPGYTMALNGAIFSTLPAAAFLSLTSITFSGGANTEGADELTINGGGILSANYTPSATTTGDGSVAITGGPTITFTGLEPVNMVGMPTATVTLPGDIDDLDITEGVIGLNDALIVSGTSGGVAIELARLRNNTTVVIDTTAVQTTGTDTIDIEGGNNSHGNTNLTINLGAGDDQVNIDGNAGPLTFTGTISINGGSGDDSFRLLNAGSLNAATVTVDGGSTGETLGDQFTADDVVNAWTITGTGAGGVTGINGSTSGTFTGMERLVGGILADTVTWTPATASTWTVNATNVVVAGLTITNAETIEGSDTAGDQFNINADNSTTLTINGRGGADEFVFAASVTLLTGSINGGAGTDELDFTAGGTVAVLLSSTGVTDGFSADPYDVSPGFVTTISDGFFNIDTINASIGSSSFLSGYLLTTGGQFNVSTAQAGTYVNTNTLNWSGFDMLQGGDAVDDFNVAADFTGTLDGVGDADTFDFTAGTFAGVANGGLGADVFTLNGSTATINGAWYGEDGLLDGSLALPFNDTDTDTFTFIAGTFAGSADGQGGNDSFMVQGAAVNGALAGNVGTDAFSITSGSFNNTFSGGDDADSFTATGGSFGASAAFDGGNDTDTVSVTANANMSLTTGSLDASAAYVNDLGLSAVEVANLTGGAVANTLTVTSWAGTIVNLNGAGDGDTYNVTLAGGTGTVNITDNGASGSDGGTLTATAGADVITVSDPLTTNSSSVVLTGGFTVNYNIIGVNNVEALTVDAVAGDDVVNANADEYTVLTLKGGNGGETLGDGLVFDAESLGFSFSATQIGVTGRAVVNYSEFESITINNPGAIVVNGDATDNSLTLTNVTDINDGNFQLDAGPVVNFTNATGFTFNGNDGDDTLTVNNRNGGLFDFNAATDITFNGGTGSEDAGGDRLVTTGSGDPASTDTGVYTPTAVSNQIALSKGTVPDVQNITINSVDRPIQDSIVLDQFTVNTTDAADTIGLVNGAAGFIRYTRTGSTSYDFANKDAVTINAGDGTAGSDVADAISVNFSEAGANVTSLTVNADEGGDTITVSAAAGAVDTTVNGNDGDDGFTLSGSADANLNGNAGTDTFGVNSGTLTGSIDAGTENDIVNFAGGHVSGSVLGNNGDDDFNFTAATTVGVGVDGGNDNDEFNFNNTGSLAGSIVGGNGSDELDYSGRSASAVTVTLSSSSASTGFGGYATSISESFSGINSVLGSTAGAADLLRGRNVNSTWTLVGGGSPSQTYSDGTTSLPFSNFDTLVGGALNDTFVMENDRVFTGLLDGSAGTDTLNYSQAANTAKSISFNATNGGYVGAPGNNFASVENHVGTTGNDTYTFLSNAGVVTGSINANTGTDHLSYAGYTVAVRSNLTSGASTNVGGGISGFENLTGGSANDVLAGNNLANTLTGGNGNDILLGGDGTDTLNGDAGMDFLVGGAGIDNMTGGAADDIFVGGSTTYDNAAFTSNNYSPYLAILSEWTRTTVPLTTRWARITTTAAISGGLNGTYRLNATTVINDLAVDIINDLTGTDREAVS